MPPPWIATSSAGCWSLPAGPLGEHALISLLALNGLRVSEAAGRPDIPSSENVCPSASTDLVMLPGPAQPVPLRPRAGPEAAGAEPEVRSAHQSIVSPSSPTP